MENGKWKMENGQKHRLAWRGLRLTIKITLREKGGDFMGGWDEDLNL